MAGEDGKQRSISRRGLCAGACGGAVALALAVAIFFRTGHTGAFAQDLPSSELPGEPIPTFSEAGEQTISAQDAGVRAAGGATWGDGSDASTSEDGKTDVRLPSSDGSDASSDSFVGPKTTRYSYELSGLPSQDGQYWIVYDILPYTERFPNLSEPQSSIIDWIFFDSGKEFSFETVYLPEPTAIDTFYTEPTIIPLP